MYDCEFLSRLKLQVTKLVVSLWNRSLSLVIALTSSVVAIASQDGGRGIIGNLHFTAFGEHQQAHW